MNIQLIKKMFKAKKRSYNLNKKKVNDWKKDIFNNEINIGAVLNKELFKIQSFLLICPIIPLVKIYILILFFLKKIIKNSFLFTL